MQEAGSRKQEAGSMKCREPYDAGSRKQEVGNRELEA